MLVKLWENALPLLPLPPGRRLGRLSAIDGEGEVLLLPNVRLVVTGEAREVEGWLTIDLIESKGDYTY